MQGVAILLTVAIAVAVMLGPAVATIRPGGSAPVALVERARAAAHFTDSIGINVYFRIVLTDTVKRNA